MPTSTLEPRPPKSLPRSYRGLPRLLDNLERPLVHDLRRQHEDYLRRLLATLAMHGPGGETAAAQSVAVPALGPGFLRHLLEVGRAGAAWRGDQIRARLEAGAWHFWRGTRHLAAGDTPAQIVVDVAERRGLFSPPVGVVERYVQTRVPPLARTSEVLRLKAQKIVADSLLEGGQSLVADLREQFPQFAEYRLANIARTETMTAFNGMSEAMAYQNPLVEGYEWCAAMDDDTCEECAELDGQSFQWSDGGPEPPMHCQCRCCTIDLFLGETDDVRYWSDTHPDEPPPQPQHQGFGKLSVEGLSRPDLVGLVTEVSQALQVAGYAQDAAAARSVIEGRRQR